MICLTDRDANASFRRAGHWRIPIRRYSLYPVLARLQDARGVGIPWERDWALPTEALAASGADAIYLANPNAPQRRV